MTAVAAESGATLVELLLGITLLATFLGMTHQFSRAMLRGVHVLEMASEAQEAARIGVQIIERDLREAGLDPAGAIASGIVRAEHDAVRLVRDLNGDGDTNDTNERVSYRYSGERGALMRGLGDAPEQPMLDDVPADGLEFRYFDAGGSVGGGVGGRCGCLRPGGSSGRSAGCGRRVVSSGPVASIRTALVLSVVP